MTTAIILNGSPHDLTAPPTVAALLEQLDIKGRRVAVMINDAIIKKDNYPAQHIAPGDRVEVIHMVGGG